MLALLDRDDVPPWLPCDVCAIDDPGTDEFTKRRLSDHILHQNPLNVVVNVIQLTDNVMPYARFCDLGRCLSNLGSIRQICMIPVTNKIFMAQ